MPKRKFSIFNINGSAITSPEPLPQPEAVATQSERDDEPPTPRSTSPFTESFTSPSLSDDDSQNSTSEFSPAPSSDSSYASILETFALTGGTASPNSSFPRPSQRTEEDEQQWIVQQSQEFYEKFRKPLLRDNNNPRTPGL